MKKWNSRSLAGTMPSSRAAHARSPSPHDAYELQPLAPTDIAASDEDPDDYIPAPYTPTESRLVLHALDTRLLPLLSLLYALSFLDRSNIGNARVAGLSSSLSLSDTQYAWLLRAFYATYIACEWMALLYRVVPAHMYISLCVGAWGVLASLQAVAASLSTLVVLRGLLGVSEAAFGPGVPFYLSFFYRREELALRTGLFVAASPLAASFAGLLAWAVTRAAEGGPVSAWRVLFLVEGFPSVVVAVWAWGVVPDGPGLVRWLGEREREVAVARVRGEHADVKGGEEDGCGLGDDQQAARGVDFGAVRATLGDPKAYMTAVRPRPVPSLAAPPPPSLLM